MNLKDELIKLGSENPELRQDLSAILGHLEKTAASLDEGRTTQMVQQAVDKIDDMLADPLVEGPMVAGVNQEGLGYDFDAVNVPRTIEVTIFPGSRAGTATLNIMYDWFIVGEREDVRLGRLVDHLKDELANAIVNDEIPAEDPGISF